MKPANISYSELVRQAIVATAEEYADVSATQSTSVVDSTTAEVVNTVLAVPFAYITSQHALSNLMLGLGTRTESREIVVSIASMFLTRLSDYELSRYDVAANLANIVPLCDASFSDSLPAHIPGWMCGLFGESFFETETDKNTEIYEATRENFIAALTKSTFMLGIFIIATYGRDMALSSQSKHKSDK